MDEETIAEIKQFVKEALAEALRPPAPVCRRSVLQDTSCVLAFGHTGLHQDKDGIWLCPWCLHDGFWGHAEDCPARQTGGMG